MKVIKVENLSKAYQLGNFGTGTISRDLERFWARLRGKEDPFLKIGEANDRTIKGDSDIVWSLKDLNFDIEQGDAVGIIGRNGAGKSTLLKILSRVTSPTTGSVKIKGRVASLLEVGTGFHPELSGRENIYLNGAILGMRRAEIKRKFDEIVDFAGVQRYIDTPVKRYSSGMYVRLAFAVAAHLESEILIVDEVLAVGDAEFQKKCLGKMGDISKGEGRTVLFVSHNMASIESLCNKGIVMANGQLQITSSIRTCINSYLNLSNNLTGYNVNYSTDKFHIRKIICYKNNQSESYNFEHNETININFKFENVKVLPKSCLLTVTVKNSLNGVIFGNHFDFPCSDFERGINLVIPSHTLLPGEYILDVLLHIPHVEIIQMIHDKVSFEVLESTHLHSAFPSHNFGKVNIKVNWT